MLMNIRLAVLSACMILPFSQAQAAFFDDDDASQKLPATGISFETAFSPDAAVSNTTVKAISQAKASIRISAYEFTSKPLSEALVKAQRAGVDAKILLDGKKSGNIDSAAQFLITMGLPPHRPKGGKTLRSSYIVIDGRDIILGDANDLADPEEERNSLGDMLVIRNAPELAKRYLDDWQAHWNDSEAIPAQK